MMEDTNSSNTITEEEWSFVNARGQSLFALEVLPAPAGAAARCVVVFAHGEGEHCRRKLGIFRAWAARGIACFAYDMHGYGASPPALGTPGRGLISNIGHSVDDMADFSAAAAARRPELDPLPWIAAGYDVGGLVIK
jgi:alpha-beta hydrolase superfamily lysophospholipase